MTDDLVQRLRGCADEWFEMCDDIHGPLNEAADRIEALQDDNAKLREAVVKFDALIKHQYTGSQWAMSDMHEAAQFGWKVLQEQSKCSAA